MLDCCPLAGVDHTQIFALRSPAGQSRRSGLEAAYHPRPRHFTSMGRGRTKTRPVLSAVAVFAIKGVIRRRNAVGLRIRMVIRDDIEGRASRLPYTATARRRASTSEGEIEQPLTRHAQIIGWRRFGQHRRQARGARYPKAVNASDLCTAFTRSSKTQSTAHVADIRKFSQNRCPPATSVVGRQELEQRRRHRPLIFATVMANIQEAVDS